MIRAIFAATLALAVLATSAIANDNPPGSYTIKSRNYEIVTNIPRSEIRELATHMDITHDAFIRMFSSFRVKNAKRVRLYLWNTREDFMRQGAAQGGDWSAAGGVFFHAQGEAGVSTWTQGKSTERLHDLLQHEGFHQFAHLRIGATLPLWANEGLAEYFEHSRLVGRKLVTGVAPRERIEAVRAAIDNGTAFTLNELLDIDGRRWHDVMLNEPHRTNAMYAQSWSIVHFLIHADDGKYQRRFVRYLERLAQGRTHDAAFKDAFNTTDTTAFNRAWTTYITEDIQPDVVSVAADRLDFIADAVAHLRDNNIHPQSLDELKQALRERQYRRTRYSDTGPVTQTPTDELFSAPAPPTEDTQRRRRGRAQPKTPQINYQPTADNALPPTISITGLELEVHVEWHTREDGQLDHTITYKR